MYKFWISIKKEYYLLVNDKTGLSLMFLMPLLLVLIITVIQDSAFKIVNDNKISLLLVNQDRGPHGTELTGMLRKSGMFEVVENGTYSLDELRDKVSEGEVLTGLFITTDFSEKLDSKSKQFSQFILSNMGLQEDAPSTGIDLPTLKFVNDPTLQDNYVYSVINVIYTNLNVIEITRMLESLYTEMGYENIPAKVKEGLLGNKIQIERYRNGEARQVPNSTQHNVPAWTIFAMFFMVISLGSNLVQEKATGSFIRLKAMPSGFALIMLSKQLVYVLVGILQVLFIFSVGAFFFPLINLPPLSLPYNVPGILTVVLASSFSAVSYALMLGAVSRTQEQSNGFGAISVIIFAAIGGVWIPTFVMPEYMKMISMISPLHWCLEAFYVLFLRGGDWAGLLRPLFILIVFSLTCQLVTYIKLRRDKLI
ncbi:MAG: ABC transporter permease [Breznakibacter sp.]